MQRILALLLLVALTPIAGAGTAPEFEPEGDHGWLPSTGNTLEWVVAGCPEIRSDVVAGMHSLEAELDRHGLLPKLERRVGIEPDPQAIRSFADPNAGTLLVQDIAGRAGADIVVGCVPVHVFQNISATHGFEDVLGLTFFSYTWDPATDLHFHTAAVIVLPEGQRIAAEGCHDPQPVGHALRRVSVMHEALHAIGLGSDHARDGGVFEEVGEADNRSCSAWWVPATEGLGPETVERLQAIWGARPGPGVFGTVAGSMQDHASWWIGLPTALIVGAVLTALVLRQRRIKAQRPARPESGIRRVDGTLGKSPSMTSGMNTFRAGEEATYAEPLPDADDRPEDMPGWDYADRNKLPRK